MVEGTQTEISFQTDYPDFHTWATEEKRRRAEYVFQKFGPPDPPKKRPFNLKPFRYINAIPEI